MTTADIETIANKGTVARDLNVGQVLRRQIVPEFLLDVKACGWRKKWATISTVAGTQNYALASDFGEMREVQIVGYEPLEYIGEDAEKVFAAKAATARARPTGYYLGRDPGSTGAAFKYLFLNAPADGVYTIRYNYFYIIPFSDDVTSVDLVAWIPDEFHWGLVEGLKREVYEDRFGLGDPRAAKAAERFEKWKSRALNNTELAKHGDYYVSIR